MRLLVGWYNPTTGQLVDIPGFDAVDNPVEWTPVFVDAAHHLITAGPMWWLCTCGQASPSLKAHEAHQKENRHG